LADRDAPYVAENRIFVTFDVHFENVDVLVAE
jgi:hypothetical protein